ncbi:Zn(II)2Cys6 transcription factor [Fusarium albosuccineum]|uniref:Zn(II)2Cys6 transcription factor n=1 Tax=Fusarium albosuccineum TaxID=1237068 RepID=A0A8H4LIA4_9HYPO|nr:Zn(II)2Cys6 transcription factor [Fusarium albosuccineum]
MAPPGLAASGANANGTPAGYGRACTACQKAKCKCILRPGCDDCERCFRLGKQCQPMMTSRRRIGKKTPSSRTAQLEEKLDDLVSILRATQSSSSAHTQPENATPSLSAYSASTAGQITSRLESLATAAATSSAESQSCHTYGTSSSSHNPIEPMMGGGNSDTILLPEPTPEEAEVYLDKFRDWLKSFPLMIIPYDMTAATLRKERPFLWLCIMNITSMSVPQQMKLKDRVREEAATRVIINHERSMDVLLGLITYVAWATMTSGPGTRPFIVTYCQLAITIVYDLSLMRAPVEEQYFTICFKMWGGRPPPPRLRTMEERRAIVSLWFITSVVTSFVGKMDTLRWTSHMDDCLTVLERDREHPSDEVLVALVRYQLVADEAQKLLIRDVMGEASQAPTYVFRKSLLTKMQDIHEGLSPNLPPNKVLQAHSFAVEAQVNSVGLFMQTIPVTQRIESMYSCLKAVRAWYDVFFAIPLEELPGAPFSLYVQMSQIQVALYRLTTSEDPAWDKDLVRNTADLLVLLDRIIDSFNQLDAIYHVRADLDDDTLFAKGAKIMRNIRTSWEPALSRHLGSTPSSSTPGVVNQQRSIPNSVQAAMNIPDANMLDFGDITWMSDVFGPWEF